MRKPLKSLALAIATLCVLPSLVFYRIRAAIVGADRALLASSQAYSLLPGILGQYLRRAFYSRTLASFHPSARLHPGIGGSGCCPAPPRRRARSRPQPP